MYKERFETIFRVARRITSSFDLGEILEAIREEAMAAIPRLREVCVVANEPGALSHVRPVDCVVTTEDVACRLAAHGRHPTTVGMESAVRGGQYASTDRCCLGSGTDNPEADSKEALLPIYDGSELVAFLFASTQAGERLAEEDLTLLKDLADLATNVIVRARHHAAVEREKAVLTQKLGHLRPFVPAVVTEIVEEHPEAPSLGKRETDVSILFLDVAGYTLLSEQLTNEKIDFMLETYFSGFFDDIYAHRGDITETAGDGLMVIFRGEPQENALNAARAALAIRWKTAQINRKMESSFEPIEVNIGINSGVASMGMSRFEGKSGVRTTFTATGAVTNLAARIASAARSGDILIGPETARRISGHIPVHDVGLISFKNVCEPVHVYSLVAPEQSLPARPEEQSRRALPPSLGQPNV
jgi:class 3 adenylate cyclase